MSKCLLCKKRDADKKGSHIVPHFLLKRIDNVDGKNGRDKELGFVIGALDTHSYFGRAVQPEKLEELYCELSDNDISEKNNLPLVVDNIFCSSCEKRLSIIENEYAKTLDKHGTVEYNSGIKTDFGLLFWMSIIWRLSINMKSGVQLSKSENEICRRILNRTLENSIEKIDLVNMQSAKDLRKVSYKLMRCPNYSNNSLTLILFHPEFKRPYSLLIDEYILCFSLNNHYEQYKTKDFFGLKDEVISTSINHVGSWELINPLAFEKLSQINESIIYKMKEIRLDNIDILLDELHVKLGGSGKMPLELKSEIFSEITSDNKKLGEKYTFQDFKDSTYKILKKIAH